MSTLTVGDVRQIRVQRAQVNHETYKSILQRVYDRIKRRAGAGYAALEFAVPPFVPGRPVFEHSHAVRYVTEKLQRGGFGVTDRGDGVLEIDWAHAAASAPASAAATAPASAAATAPAPPTRSDREPYARGAIRPVGGGPVASQQDEIARRLSNLKRRLKW